MQVHKLCPLSYLNSNTYCRFASARQGTTPGDYPSLNKSSARDDGPVNDASAIASYRWPATSGTDSVGNVWSLRGLIDLAFMAHRTMAVCSQGRLIAINLSSGYEPARKE
jgi:hypothetical protein